MLRTVRKGLPAYLKPPVVTAYHTGMRKEEIFSLQWPQVDLMEGKINLRSEGTKNKEPKVIFLEGELVELIRFQRALRDQKFPSCPWVFFGETGERIKDFRYAWDTALRKAGLAPKKKCRDCGNEMEYTGKWKKRTPCSACGSTNLRRIGRIPHDSRRTALKNMARAGMPERVAMVISGHKTRSVFERYNIVNENDLKLASKRVKEYHLERVKLESGHNLGTVEAQEAQTQLEGPPAIY